MTTSTSTKSTAAKVPAARAKTTTNPVKAAVAKATGRKSSTPSKECRTCHIVKPLTDFRNKASRPDGVDTNCAACSRAWLANRKIVKAQLEAAAAKPKRAQKIAPAKVVAKAPAKVVAKPVLPAREAAARAKDATPRSKSVAK